MRLVELSLLRLFSNEWIGIAITKIESELSIFNAIKIAIVHAIEIVQLITSVNVPLERDKSKTGAINIVIVCICCTCFWLNILWVFFGSLSLQKSVHFGCKSLGQNLTGGMFVLSKKIIFEFQVWSERHLRHGTKKNDSLKRVLWHCSSFSDQKMWHEVFSYIACINFEVQSWPGSGCGSFHPVLNIPPFFL